MLSMGGIQTLKRKSLSQGASSNLGGERRYCVKNVVQKEEITVGTGKGLSACWQDGGCTGNTEPGRVCG